MIEQYLKIFVYFLQIVIAFLTLLAVNIKARNGDIAFASFFSFPLIIFPLIGLSALAAVAILGFKAIEIFDKRKTLKLIMNTSAGINDESKLKEQLRKPILAGDISQDRLARYYLSDTNTQCSLYHWLIMMTEESGSPYLIYTLLMLLKKQRYHILKVLSESSHLMHLLPPLGRALRRICELSFKHNIYLLGLFPPKVDEFRKEAISFYCEYLSILKTCPNDTICKNEIISALDFVKKWLSDISSAKEEDNKMEMYYAMVMDRIYYKKNPDICGHLLEVLIKTIEIPRFKEELEQKFDGVLQAMWEYKNGHIENSYKSKFFTNLVNEEFFSAIANRFNDVIVDNCLMEVWKLFESSIQVNQETKSVKIIPKNIDVSQRVDQFCESFDVICRIRQSKEWGNKTIPAISSYLTTNNSYLFTNNRLMLKSLSQILHKYRCHVYSNGQDYRNIERIYIRDLNQKVELNDHAFIGSLINISSSGCCIAFENINCNFSRGNRITIATQPGSEINWNASAEIIDIVNRGPSWRFHIKFEAPLGREKIQEYENKVQPLILI